MPKTAVLIGFGGMGKRYYKALNLMNIKILAICEKNLKNLSTLNLKKTKELLITNNYTKLLNLEADILCVASNTGSRFKIIKNFAEKGKIKKIITEKPLSTTYEECLNIEKIIKKKRIRIIINTHRSLSPNFLMIKKIFKNYNETPNTIFINSPSAGLGNMGSTFFDLGLFFFDTKVKSAIGNIDKTGTVNPRGKKFIDPGGYGIIRFDLNKKLFFNLSENTGLPYEIIVKSENLEIVIDEINNKFVLKERIKKMRNRPLYFYLFKPKIKKLKIKHKFDVAKMTCFSIKEIFKKKFSYYNLKKAINVMGCIFAVHASSKYNKSINLPLEKKYHKIKVNFA
tara:strand:- start:9339 stop:10358 length:1020 start_codon:yes stop_codon:yes gene_type:complete